MIELIFELIFNALGEIILQIFIEALFEIGLESVGNSIKGRRTSNPILAGFGFLILGAISGLVSSWIMPNRLFPQKETNGISLLLAPLGTGFLMMNHGKWCRAKGGDPSYLATFWGGGLFAFSMALVRWRIVGN